MKAWAIAEGEKIVAIRIAKKHAEQLCKEINSGYYTEKCRVIPVTVTVDEKEKE